MSAYFIIEHPTRGILKYESEVGEPHFGSSFMRNDERAYRTYSLSEAQRIRDRFTNDKTRDKCYILRSPVGDEVDWVNAEANIQIYYHTDYEAQPVGKPVTRQEALQKLAALSEEELRRYDLVSTETGRYVSWVLP